MVAGASDVGDNYIHRLAMDDPVPWYKKRHLRTMYLLLFPCVIGIEMTSGFDSQIINSAQLLPAWKHYFGNPTGAYNGILASALPLGSVIGLPLIPLVNDTFGRRWCIMFGSWVMVIGTLIQGFATNGPMYIIARGIIGFGLPYAIVAGSCLIGELGYPKERPILTSLFNACYFIGAIVAAGCTFGTQNIENDWSWRIPSLLQMAPSLLQIAFVFFLPESPRFLISKDRFEDAKAILIKYHAEGNSQSEFVMAEIAEIRTTLEIEMEHSKRSWLDMVRTAGMRRRLVIGSLLGLFTQLSGNVVISYFLGDVLKLIGYTDPSFQTKYNLGNQCWSLICGVSAALVVMRFRRRTMYLTGILSILAVYVSWTICTAVFIQNKSDVAAKMSLFWIYAYSPAYNLCFNALTYTYLIEIFPYAQRARGIAIFQFWGKAAQFFGTNVNPIGTLAIGWKYLLTYCCWICVEAILIWFLWPETSGRSLEELAFLFEDRQALEQSTAVASKRTAIHEEESEKHVAVIEAEKV
ncbi:general substrate transporter [Lasiosphaeria miniovina]|uniref:General substrate transporter n=1 Tax=Lasiosphaeria miniovina TaxID=1954250 RepID=A0AA40E7I6_9PEZI|nr:general substrate transporter [Lasiosphaeria miniovina]KAK0726891.1 general substrate transporter [Lasiosphaeria miniovina]